MMNQSLPIGPAQMLNPDVRDDELLSNNTVKRKERLQRVRIGLLEDRGPNTGLTRQRDEKAVDRG
jgi:hypothetical protein